jgi:hypothetical protein
MFRLTTILPPAAVTALAVIAAAPANAFVGYGVQAGTPLYEDLQHGYRPDLHGPRYIPLEPR